MSKQQFTVVEAAVLSGLKVDFDPGKIEPGEYEGTVVVEVDYKMTVGSAGTSTSRDGAGSANLEAVLMMALDMLEPAQVAKVGARLSQFRDLKGKQRESFLAAHTGAQGREFMDTHFPYVTTGRAGSKKVEAEVRPAGAMLVEDPVQEKLPA